MPNDENAKELKKKFQLKITPKEDIITLLFIVIGCIVQAGAINALYRPHEFLSGGVTGISLLFQYTMNIPTWITILVLNLPICLIGIFYLDLKFAIFSIIATFLFSGAMALTGFLSINVDPMLAAIFGGAIVGIIGSPVVKHNATLGGMDVVALILSRKLSIPMGNFNILFNLVIMTILGFIRGIELAMYSMLAMFVCNAAFDAAMMGLNRMHTVFIISDMWDEIAPEVMRDMKRGVTYIPAVGAYTGVERKVVYCIVKTVELARLKSIVMKYDKHAMFSVIDTKQVIGRGFGAVN